MQANSYPCQILSQHIANNGCSTSLVFDYVYNVARGSGGDDAAIEDK